MTIRLSFASYFNDGRIDYWQGDHDADASGEGRRRASELCEIMQGDATNAAILLPFISEAIAQKGNFGLMERSFYHRLSEFIR